MEAREDSAMEGRYRTQTTSVLSLAAKRACTKNDLKMARLLANLG